MQFEIEERVKRTVEVALPYYYEHDLSERRTYCIYGAIFPDTTYLITHSTDQGDESWEITISPTSKRDGSYFKEEFESSKEVFEAARDEALIFINSFMAGTKCT